eukprot:775315-Pelagomonas_calceolata.AAC.1
MHERIPYKNLACSTKLGSSWILQTRHTGCAVMACIGLLYLRCKDLLSHTGATYQLHRLPTSCRVQPQGCQPDVQELGETNGKGEGSLIT